jgi:hypothetical protein
MVMFIKESGKMVWHVAKESSLIPKGPCMKANGLMMHTMEREQNSGITTKSYTKVTLLVGLKLVMVNLNSMEIYMKEISLTVNSTVKENTSSMKPVRFMKEISMRIRFMEVGLCFGPTELSIKENTNTVKWKAME